jgi:hypothetical protein
MKNYMVPIPEYLMEAARVVDFMEERQSGRWRTKLFEITEEEFHVAMMKHEVSGDSRERIELRQAREVPPGQYVTLQRRCTPEEERAILKEHGIEDVGKDVIDKFFPPETRWVPVMSDTPSEIQEHAHALLNATGRVLINGLGLGCLPHALLAKPGITHIDIVEIDPDVIDLTDNFIDPRVHIHRGDASNPWAIFPKGTTWDYAWHDIWSQISDDNLDDDSTAEHGISYERLFEMYREHVTEQHAWAYDEALHMRDVYDREVERELEFRAAVKAMPLEQQIEALYDKVIRSRLRVWPQDKPVPPEAMAMFDPNGELREHLRRKLTDKTFWEDLERDHPAEAEAKKPSMPNRHLEDANANA